MSSDPKDALHLLRLFLPFGPLEVPVDAARHIGRRVAEML